MSWWFGPSRETVGARGLLMIGVLAPSQHEKLKLELGHLSLKTGNN